MIEGRPISALVCAGCGGRPLPVAFEPYPFRCRHQRKGDGIDHVVTRTLDAGRVRIPRSASSNPFLRYRDILHSYHQARAHGVGDTGFCAVVERLSTEIERVDGRPVEQTPLVRSRRLEQVLGMAPNGAVWIKDETGNVSGSHKGRHLTGVMLYLEVVERLGLGGPHPRELAIASCGNAALSAAVVARAAGRALRVFVPSNANESVMRRLRKLGATIETCERTRAAAGDPAYLRFRAAVDAGALPFGCQGPDNGLTIEGAETLPLEIVEGLSGRPLHRIFVQVGGGALASACVQGLALAVRMGLLATLPRIHAVQTRGAAPLKRAYDRVVEHGANTAATGAALPHRLWMQYARAHRSEFMWPWETEPRSAAHGILDDETYDWAAVVEGLLDSGGSVLVVSEPEIETANAIGRESTGIDVDHTGTAGLAGLVHALAKDPALRDEHIAVIFSGVRRAT